jgi:hypothetical protein
LNVQISTFPPFSNITPLILLPSPTQDVIGTDESMDGTSEFTIVQEPPFDYPNLNELLEIVVD